MSELPNAADFIADDRPGEYEATFSVSGTIRMTINAGSLEEAKEKAVAIMTEDEDFGLELDEVDDVSARWFSKTPPMFLVIRDGKTMRVSRLKAGDTPRQPDERGF